MNYATRKILNAISDNRNGMTQIKDQEEPSLLQSAFIIIFKVALLDSIGVLMLACNQAQIISDFICIPIQVGHNL